MTSAEPLLELDVAISLGGETRTVRIERFTERHCWFAKDAAVTCRFRTGTKLHRVLLPQVVERGGTWFFPHQTVANRHCYPIAWNDGERSGWT